MPAFPPAPIAPPEFFERWLPEAFASEGLPPDAMELDLVVGVRLRGEGGGEWLVHLERGSLRVEAGATEHAAFTLIQTVADWRGSLWEGRGGAFGRQAAALFQPGARPAGPAARAASPAGLAQLRALNGLVRMVVTDEAAGDWIVDFKLGPGPVPDEPSATVRISAEDAGALERGELDPMQAFLSGRVQIAGDMTLLLQMQVAQMQGGGLG